MREVVEEFHAERGGADVLIYNAGISPSYASAEKVEEKDWDDILATNLTGAFCAAQAFARPLIVDGAPGSVVFIGSVNSVVGDPRLVAYTASKAGLAGMAKTMALDWARYGIRVNTVAPGYVATDLTAGLQRSERLRKSLTDRTPQNRLAEPREIADLVVFLGLRERQLHHRRRLPGRRRLDLPVADIRVPTLKQVMHGVPTLSGSGTRPCRLTSGFRPPPRTR